MPSTTYLSKAERIFASSREPLTTDRALARLDQLSTDAPGDGPVFLWVHYIDPHVPYHPSAEGATVLDPGYAGEYALHFGWQRQPGEPAAAHRPFPENLTKREAVHNNPLPESVNAHIRRLYAADIREVDAQVGRLVEGVRERLGENVLLVFTADHGESLGEHDYYWDHGEYVYSASSRVPLAFVMPKDHPLHGKGRCRAWVSLVDIVPTLLDLLSVTAPADMLGRINGRSLVGCLEGGPIANAPVFIESGRSFSIKEIGRRRRNDVPGSFRAVVQGDWKLIWTPFAPEEEAWQLFDLAADPDEEHDLYRPDHPHLGALQLVLAEWAARRSPNLDPPHVMSVRDEAALRELGYLE
jgi:arylsulfatase A-like enzyme